MVVSQCFGDARSVPAVGSGRARRRRHRLGGCAHGRAGPGGRAQGAGGRSGARRHHVGRRSQGGTLDGVGPPRTPRRGGLVTVESSGRHRYFRLASPEVAEALEALARLAPHHQVRSLSQGTHAEAIRRARTCYDHLAGRLGVAVLDALVATGALHVHEVGEGSDPVLGAGRARAYLLTDAGASQFAALGVALDPPTRRPLTRYCIDWSEQRPHLAGWLGAALLTRFVGLGWVLRAPRRVVKVTEAGWTGLAERLAVDVDVCR